MLCLRALAVWWRHLQRHVRCSGSYRRRPTSRAGQPLMRWLETLWHRSSVLRLAVRAVVLALTAWPLLALALTLQPKIASLSPSIAVVALTSLVLIESALFTVITMLFRKVQ